MFCQLKKKVHRVEFSGSKERWNWTSKGKISKLVKRLWRMSNATQNFTMLSRKSTKINWCRIYLYDETVQNCQEESQTSTAEQEPSSKSDKHITQLWQTVTLRGIMPQVCLLNPFIHSSLLWNELKTGCSQYHAVPEPLHSTKTGAFLHFCSLPQSSSSSVLRAAASACFLSLSSGVTCHDPWNSAKYHWCQLKWEQVLILKMQSTKYPS